MNTLGLGRPDICACSGLTMNSVRHLLGDEPVYKRTMDRFIVFVNAVEGCFLPGMEPRLHDWYTIEDAFMPVNGQDKTIRNLRRNRKMLVPQASRRAGVDVYVWRNWEEMRKPVSPNMMPLVAEVLCVNAQQLQETLHQARNAVAFGRWMTEQRDSREMSQDTLAARLRVTRNSIIRWEAGTSRFPTSRLNRLARALDLRIDDALRAYRSDVTVGNCSSDC